MGKHVSIGVNIVTALSVWVIGVLGGIMVITNACDFVYWLITHLYKKATLDDYLWILTVVIIFFLLRNRISFAKKTWKLLFFSAIILFCVPFLKLAPNLTNTIVLIYKSYFFQIVLLTFILWASFYVFRYSFLASMIAGLYISNLGFKPTKDEVMNYDKSFNEFTSNYKFDILNISHIKKPWTLWKLFFWQPKTVAELAKDQAFNDAVAKRVEELKNEKGVKTNG